MNNILQRILSTNNNYATLPLRLALGLVMVGHGAQKLFGWFGGYGLEGTGQFFAETLGLQPGVLMAAMAGGGEFFGGLFVLVGLFTRPAAAVLAFTMFMAIVTVHSSAFFLSNSGMEYVLTLLLASVALVISGGGALSVDKKAFSK